MTPSRWSNVPPAKRHKLGNTSIGEAEGTAPASTTLERPVSPPTSKRSTPVAATASLLAPEPTWSFDDVPKQELILPRRKQADQIAASSAINKQQGSKTAEHTEEYIASPFQLTKIRDLASHQNVDAVELKDILGNPMIKECWNFNFLFDIHFVMQQFDEDVRDLVKVKVIHGFWRRDDERRIALMETAGRYPNIELINAYLPDPFGTHHSKMLILFRHDYSAQVVIHTANMIAKDWTNMTQAVWRSPLLPLRSDIGSTEGPHAVGNGHRFHLDLCRYLLCYEKRLQRLIEQLALYDFSTIRAAFLGSAPSRQALDKANPSSQTSWGWLGLQEILSSVPTKASKNSKKPPHFVLQVSSIATLGAAPMWLSHFYSVLEQSPSQQASAATKPKLNIIFPTPEEVRTSLDGYDSGGSIHMRVQSAQQQKQLQYLHPLLCHWKQSSPTAPQSSAEPRKEAHRGPAAPHIKTYVRFTDDTHENIDWALLTSANLSKQAWGDVVNKQGEVRIQSYETGVLVWPDLFAAHDSGCDVCMVPSFGKDMPNTDNAPTRTLKHEQSSQAAGKEGDDEQTEDECQGPTHDDDKTEDESEQAQLVEAKQSKAMDKGKAPLHIFDKKRIVVGLRMPYDLPLSSYSAKDVPWCATQQYTEPDWKGRAWGGF